MAESESVNIVVIGSSTGGPRILEKVFTDMPKLNASVVIVHHMPKMMNHVLQQALDERTNMRVKMAEKGEELEPGTVYLAPSEIHLRVFANKWIQLFDGERVNRVRPSIDVAMESLRSSEDSLVGVILTGAGEDGANGISHIKKSGGYTITQDPLTSPVPTMPKTAFETGNVDIVLTPDEIREKLVELVGVVQSQGTSTSRFRA